MIAAKAHSASNGSFVEIFSKATLIIALAGAFLIVGYMLGYKSFKNIWIVSALSITSILFMEPLIGYLVFKQLPTTGAAVGLVFGAIGFIVTFM